MRRRDFIKTACLLSFGASAFVRAEASDIDRTDFTPIFDGATLSGWRAVPRNPRMAPDNTGRFVVEDGVLIGGQEPPGSGIGAYLVSEEKFGDFELLIDAKPDWGVDTGVLVRTMPAGQPGYQMLVDHRKSGGIGGFYGNGLKNFHAIQYVFDAKYDDAGNPIGLILEEPDKTAEFVTEEKKKLPNYYIPFDDFIKIWKWNDWNTFRIRCVGKYPHLTSWVNGVKVCELDTSTMVWPGFDKDEVFNLLGREGHISLEVHDSSAQASGWRPSHWRWGVGKVCRWKNIYVKKL